MTASEINRLQVCCSQSIEQSSPVRQTEVAEMGGMSLGHYLSCAAVIFGRLQVRRIRQRPNTQPLAISISSAKADNTSFGFTPAHALATASAGCLVVALVALIFCVAPSRRRRVSPTVSPTSELQPHCAQSSCMSSIKQSAHQPRMHSVAAGTALAGTTETGTAVAGIFVAWNDEPWGETGEGS